MITQKEISGKAFDMFRDWTKNVHKKYPELIIALLDESVLVQNLENAIKNAKKALLTEEKTEKRKTEGYDVGFMLGFIESNLNIEWELEYIIKQKSAYKEFIALKAIKLFFEFDELTVIRIESIYKNLIINNSNIQNLSYDFSPEGISELSVEKVDDTSESFIMKALNSQIDHYIAEYVKNDHENFMEPCEKYFSDYEIQEIFEKSK
jgi:hypothetical protein